MIVDLFIIDEKDNVQLNPETRETEPYRELFARDKGEKNNIHSSEGRTKVYSKKVLLWIYHMCDPRSFIYQRYSDVQERNINVVNRVGLPDNWKPSQFEIKVAETYQSDIQNDYIELLEGARDSILALKTYYSTMESKLADPKFNIKAFQDSVSNLAELLRGIEKLKKEAIQGIRDKSKIRGGGEEGHFENPDNF